MPIAYQVLGTQTTGGAAASATLPVEASQLGPSFGLVALVRRYVGTAQADLGRDPAPDHAAMQAAGWTLIRPTDPAAPDGARQTSGTFRVGLYAYRRRGNGQVNSVTVPNTTGAVATTNATRVRLIAVPNVKEDEFVVPPTAGQYRATTNLAQLTAADVTTTEADSTIIGFASTGAGSGGQGFTWPAPAGMTQEDGQSTTGSSTVSFAWDDVPTAATAQDVTAAWTTPGVGALLALALKTRLVTASPSGNGTRTTIQRWSASSMANAVSMTVAQLSGPAVTVTKTGLVAEFPDVEGRTADVVLRFTVDNGAGGTTVRDVTFPPGSGSVEVVERRTGGTIVRRADGLIY